MDLHPEPGIIPLRFAWGRGPNIVFVKEIAADTLTSENHYA
jgi:hypothetical protein